jgi:hypothetical protein
VHLAGGVHSARDRFWTDTHDQPIDEEVFALLPVLRGVAPCARPSSSAIAACRRWPSSWPRPAGPPTC